jgi:DNA-binding response OmpR family regulator
MANNVPVIAVINGNEEIIEALRELLGDEGFLTVGAHLHAIKKGTLDFIAFIEEEDPQVIILDIPPPYEENVIFSRLLASTQALRNRPIVFATTNKPLVERLLGVEVYEIVGKPFDLREIVKAVCRALQRNGIAAEACERIEAEA